MNRTILIRWRGHVSGPIAQEELERRLATNEIGLSHEIQFNGTWMSLRVFLKLKQEEELAECARREEEKRFAQEEIEIQQRLQAEKAENEKLVELKRQNDLLAAGVERQAPPSSALVEQQVRLKSHRGGLILTLGLIGLFVFGPLCLAAWIMGSGDLNEMDAGIMDASGRSTTSSGRNIGILGTILWIICVIFIFIF
jgi:hypothetical protein